jgi:diguanylate cyclase (GGDEF)-like protein
VNTDPRRVEREAAARAPGRTPLHLRIGAVVTVASLVASVAVAVRTEAGSLEGTVAYLVPVALAVLLTAAAVVRVPHERRRPWLWLLLAMVMYLVGELMFAVLDLSGNESWPTPADAVYIAAYVPVTIGLFGLNRQRGGSGHRGNLLDASIVTLSVATLFGTFVILPIAADGSQSMLVRVVASAYPIADVVWMFILARMATGPGARTPAFWLLAAGTLSTVAADVSMNIHQLLIGGDANPIWMNVLWQAFYICLALAACTESARRLGEPKPRADRGLTVSRLLVLAVAAVLPSLVLLGLALSDNSAPTAWLSVGSVLLICLVVTRIWDLLQKVRSQAGLLEALARTDPLTGAANRRTWDHELGRACAAATESGERLFVALLDLDHFKVYNDAHGHQAGDALLKAATAAWSDYLGGAGFLARWGGEEFAVLMRSPDTDGALARLDGMRLVIPEQQTCSIGVAAWDGREEAFTLIRRADEALYAAKTHGRDRLMTSPELTPVPASSGPSPASPPTQVSANA